MRNSLEKQDLETQSGYICAASGGFFTISGTIQSLATAGIRNQVHQFVSIIIAGSSGWSLIIWADLKIMRDVSDIWSQCQSVGPEVSHRHRETRNTRSNDNSGSRTNNSGRHKTFVRQVPLLSGQVSNSIKWLDPEIIGFRNLKLLCFCPHPALSLVQGGVRMRPDRAKCVLYQTVPSLSIDWASDYRCQGPVLAPRLLLLSRESHE